MEMVALLGYHRGGEKCPRGAALLVERLVKVVVCSEKCTLVGR